MIAAAFETSTRQPSVALRVGGEIHEERLSGSRAHASDLLPALERLLLNCGRSVRDIELLVVGRGPGSFTGLRVAVATALGLARGSGASLFGLCSFEALCWRELSPGEEAAVVLDARGGEFYFAHYRRTDGELEVLRAPCMAAPAQLIELIGGRSRVFCDAGVASAPDLLPPLGARLSLDLVPAASALLELGLRRFAREGSHGIEALEPLYLRAFGVRH